ncbi:hypothetical protein K9F62_19820 [Desulfovibrio sp. JY]|nr:hypothetical protein K9F62_19820 [Desulfovibrio sp. JY]
MSSANGEVVIDLAQSREANALKAEELIHQPALRTIARLIGDILKRREDYVRALNSNNKGLPVRTHDVITINGQRGVGKSTFVLSVLKILDSEGVKGLLPKGDYGLAPKENFHCLDVIDPTFLGDREVVLLTILQRIYQAVDDHRKKRCSSLEEHSDQRYESWQEKLRRLAKGLQVVGEFDNGNGKNPDVSWEDEQFLLHEGISKAKHGRDFERDFRNIIHDSLALIGRDVFVLVFDDIDTRIDSGWKVLEVIRKYLTTPELIVLLSGDIGLYETVVRKEQMKQFDLNLKYSKDDVRNTERENELIGIVDQLTGQYLMKVAKPSNMVDILNFGEYLRGVDTSILVNKSVGPKEVAIDVLMVLKYIVKECLFYRSSAEVEVYARVLADHPARTVVEILRCYSSIADDSWEVKPDAAKGGDKLGPAEGISPAKVASPARKSFHAGLAKIFYVPLHRLGFTTHQIQGIGSAQSFGDLITNLHKHGMFQHGVRLLPEFTEQAANDAMLALGACWAEAMTSNPALWLEYMLKVSLTKELMSWSGKDDVLEYVKHVGLTDIANSLKVARFSVSYIQQNPSDSSAKKMKFGTLGTSSYRNYIKSWQKKYARLPFSKVVASGGEFTFVSIFSIIGAVVELLSLGGSGPLSFDEQVKVFRNKIEDMAQLRSYPVFGFAPVSGEKSARIKQTLSAIVAEDVDDIFYDMGYAEEAENFIKNLVLWGNYWKKQVRPVPVAVWSKAMTRFCYTLVSIDNAIPIDKAPVGRYLHRCIIAFFNAVLVEEYLHLGVDTGTERVTLANPVTSDRIFSRNLAVLGLAKPFEFESEDPIITCDIAYDENEDPYEQEQNEEIREGTTEYSEDFRLFRMLFSCPLWGLFLRAPTKIMHGYTYNVFNQHIIHSSQCCGGKLPYVKCIKSLEVVYADSSKDRCRSINMYKPLNMMCGRAVEGDGLSDTTMRGGILSYSYAGPSTAQLSYFEENSWSDTYKKMLKDYSTDICAYAKILDVKGIESEVDKYKIYDLWMPLEKLYYPSSRLKPTSSRFVKQLLPNFASIILPKMNREPNQLPA